jgi:hypothetical protein
MSRVLKVYNSDYKVSVADGGTITLDTGDVTGTTVVTGNLEVKGTTTTVDSTQVTIADNIIVLSEGTQGAGLPSSVGYVSGIQIDRGSLSPAQWLFDERVSWTLGGDSGIGTFYATTLDGSSKLPLNTPGIVAQGNLYVDTGAGVISVTNTSDYEEKIWNYNNGVITPDANSEIIIDDDHIPNAKSVKDYVEYIFAAQFYDTIAQGDSNIAVIDEIHKLGSIISVTQSGTETSIRTVGQHGFTTADTVDISGVLANGDPIENLNGNNIQITEIVSATAFKVNIDTTGGNIANYVSNSGTIRKTGFEPSRVAITVDGINNTNVYNDRFETQDIRIEGSTITTTSSNQDLVLGAPGSGAVKVSDVLEIPSSPYAGDVSIDPIAPGSGIKVYSKPEGSGQTGLYFVNSNNTYDEFIGRNRALLFSLIF